MIKQIFFIISCWLLGGTFTKAQSLTIESCYQLAKENYPVIKKMDLIAAISDNDLQYAAKKFLPQVIFSGQATYQSQVMDYGSLFGSTSSPIGMNAPSLSKDQYRIQAEISQLLYDGGVTQYQNEQIDASKALQKQQIETQLYAINSRINTIFFSILLMDAQLKQHELVKANLQTQVQKVEVALKNGVAFRSNLDELKAEMLQLEMTGTEYRANRIAFLKMLSLFIGKELDVSVVLFVPNTEVRQTTINRPELMAFELQNKIYHVQSNSLKTSYLPQVSAFFQGAYGRPTLNIIENKFGPWYLTGLRFNWSLGSLYSLSNRKSNLLLQQQLVDVDKETFLFNTRLDLSQQDENIKKYIALILQDEEVIALRAAVTKSATAQLNNGVITTHEFIQKVNAEHLARQLKVLHEIQLLQAKYNQKFLTGI